jgi:hypothetical protein
MAGRHLFKNFGKSEFSACHGKIIGYVPRLTAGVTKPGWFRRIGSGV